MKYFITTIIMFGACLLIASQARAAEVVERVSFTTAIDNYSDDSAETCVNELKKAYILDEGMELLGTKRKVINDHTLIGVTAVVGTSGKEEYYVMSCRINSDNSGHVDGPMKIRKSLSYFTRNQPRSGHDYPRTVASLDR